MAVKQKIVVKLSMEDAKKRSRALRTAVGLPGVVSVALDGEKILVVGEIDPVELTLGLRKKMGYAELLSVGAAEEEKKKAEEKKKVEEKKVEVQQLVYPYQVWQPYQGSMGHPVIMQDNSQYDPNCSVM